MANMRRKAPVGDALAALFHLVVIFWLAAADLMVVIPFYLLMVILGRGRDRFSDLFRAWPLVMDALDGIDHPAPRDEPRSCPPPRQAAHQEICPEDRGCRIRCEYCQYRVMRGHYNRPNR